MIRPEHRAALTEEVARFQAEVHQLALDAARAIVAEELARRHARRAPLRALAAAAAAPARMPRTPRAMPTASTAAATAANAAAGAPAGAPTAGDATAAATSATAAAAPATGGKRARWTRETIISELATWMIGGTAIDAAFITRHGPPGLVAAARRVFGRFEAALNVAGLRVSELYPDGPPER